MARGGRRKGRGARRSAATGARLAALDITREVRIRSAYVRELLDGRRDTCGLASEEFSFAQVLAFGVMMCRGTLDELIDRNLNSPNDIKDDVRDCLRISAYEMLFLGKPAHAAVDQGVELVRSIAPKASGLANAVLRKMARDAKEFPWGDASTSVDAFARRHGVPVWLASRIEEQYGHEEASAVLTTSLQPAPTYLVDNPYVPGTTFASDLSAQRVAELVPIDSEVLEIGAGRGTKTLLLQKRAFEKTGKCIGIDAVELHEYRVKIIEARMSQMGVYGVRAFAGDARNLAAIEGLAHDYGSVFVDAPCSGTGTMRRHPEIRWRLKAADVDSLAQLQYELVCEAATKVRAGGALVYATCSIFEQENERVVERFLASENGAAFELEHTFSTLPTEGGPDGHFAAVMRRQTTERRALDGE